MENNRPVKVIIAGKNFVRVCDYLKTELPEISLEMVESKDLIKKAKKLKLLFRLCLK